ncbi:MAG: MFS transporter [Bifidobacterium aquikefiri]|uniref:Major facilitator superfamily protein n=1 Tax=Bifidobacterium aquikefiri TaxID=1653207 RepID=A0A261G8J0_9BIFI|nr:MFS transporter [Bifidobacterium aquikefiri]OZG67738.1 major facilitator superfamily protein [Bifidobacterium aquikefiri]
MTSPSTDFSGIWRKNSYLFLFSQFITGITSMIVQYAIIWYLTQKSGSATILSIATILAMLPMVLVSPFIGTFVDRWNKKALLIVPDMVAAAVAIMLCIVGTINETFPLWLIFGSLLIRSIAQAFQMPTVQSILPTMVPPEEITKVNGQLGMVQSGTLIISPALGALLYAAVPINYLLLIDVLGAAFSFGSLMFVHIVSNSVEPESKARPWADMVYGLKRIGSAPGMWSILAMAALSTLTFMPAASLYPLMTLGYFKGTIFQAGVVEVLWSVGSLAGGALIGIFGKWKNRIPLIIAGQIVLGLAFMACSVLPVSMPGFVLFVGFNFIAGLATAFPSTLSMALIQQSYPAGELGRIFGVCLSITGIAGPIGLLFVGPLGDAIGVEWVFAISGLGAVLCGLFIIAVPSARLYDKRLRERIERNEIPGVSLTSELNPKEL